MHLSQFRLNLSAHGEVGRPFVSQPFFGQRRHFRKKHTKLVQPFARTLGREVTARLIRAIFMRCHLPCPFMGSPATTAKAAPGMKRAPIYGWKCVSVKATGRPTVRGGEPGVTIRFVSNALKMRGVAKALAGPVKAMCRAGLAARHILPIS